MARYPTDLLAPGENIIKSTHPDVAMLVVRMLWLPAAVAGAIAAWTLLDDPVNWQAALGVAVVTVAVAGWQLLDWWATTYTLTTVRIVARGGILSRWGTEVALNRVTNVTFAATLLQRLLRAGDLAIKSASDNAPTYLTHISNPQQFQATIYRQLPESAPTGDESAPTAAGPPPGSADDDLAKLERLTRLHSVGRLTDEEFTAAKRRLLDL